MKTDLAIEFMADKAENEKGITKSETFCDDIKVTSVKILNQKIADEFGKPIGEYITLESSRNENIFDLPSLANVITENIKRLLGNISGTVLVVGIGNTEVTPDALGPKTAAKILATRHLKSELTESLGLGNLKPVAAIAPGVLGQTGIEVQEIVRSVSDAIKPHIIILIDALAAKEVSRLGCTLQISNTGICPGSGVGNKRAELSDKTLGVPCITLGVPTVADASLFLSENLDNSYAERFIITPREIDRMIEATSSVLADALNHALQPFVDRELLSLIV